MKILVMKFLHIGDTLLTTPLLRNLRLNFPDAQIDMALNAGTEALLRYNPDISNLYIYNRPRIKNLPLPIRLKEEWEFVSQFRKKYDIVINTTPGERGAIIAKISGADIRVGLPPKKGLFRRVYNFPLPRQSLRHTLETNLDPLRTLGGEVYEKRVYLHWSREAEERVNQLDLPRRFVHLHPVSRWMFKSIPVEIGAKIVEFIGEKLDIPVVVTSAPEKRELEHLQKLEEMVAQKGGELINLGGQLGLEEVAYLNSQALFFVGADTGVMHISAGNDTPTFAIFGPSGAFHWGPWDNRLMESGYTRHRGIQKMGRHLVYQLDWECIPCGKDGCNGSKKSECLLQIPIGDLLEQLERWWEGVLK